VGWGVLLNDEEFRALAEEQAALRRVATLVARGVPPREVFAAVTEEVGKLLPVEFAIMGRYEPEEVVVAVAAWRKTGNPWPPVGSRWPLDGKNLVTVLFKTGRPARIDSYADASGSVGVNARAHEFRSTVGAPIIVEGRSWGAMTVGSTELEEPLPPDAEAHLVSFTELLATAIANAESRTELTHLLEEQAALRRVATLVARRTPPEQVFAAVTEEIGLLLGVDWANMARYEPEGTVTYVATWSRTADRFPIGSRWAIEGRNLVTLVFETGRPVRLDNYPDAPGGLAATLHEAGVRSGVGSPVIVDGRLWGVVGVASRSDEPLPTDTEVRLASFTELVAMAIANTESRTQLKMSRARIVAAADKGRQQIERDLHDGTQQQLVSLMLELRAAEAKQPADADELQAKLDWAAQALDGVLEELREVSRGIHPAILSKAGLGPALKTLARRSTVPVELTVRVDRRPPDHVEVAAYFVVCEALANAAKHSEASLVNIALDASESNFQLSVGDDGVGGADPSQGSGLVGLADRVEALGGRLEITSPAGRGTLLSLEIPLESQRGAALSPPSGRP
jgi:signal transduction histidine kinase